MILPAEAAPLLADLAPAFTTLTCTRIIALLAAAVLTTGRHKVANLLRSLGPLPKGHRIDYQRVLPRVPWSGVQLDRPIQTRIAEHPVHSSAARTS